jgi:hypothetical protein
MKAILGASFLEEEAIKSWPTLRGLMGLALGTGKGSVVFEAVAASTIYQTVF